MNEHPRYAASLHVPDHSVAHTAADFVYEIAKVYGKSRLELLAIQAQGLLKAARDAALRTGSEAPEKAQAAAAFAREAAVELFSIAKEKGRARPKRPGQARASSAKSCVLKAISRGDTRSRRVKLDASVYDAGSLKVPGLLFARPRTRAPGAQRKTTPERAASIWRRSARRDTACDR